MTSKVHVVIEVPIRAHTPAFAHRSRRKTHRDLLTRRGAWVFERCWSVVMSRSIWMNAPAIAG
eukprot:5541677-Amphidinium_carterae.1